MKEREVIVLRKEITDKLSAITEEEQSILLSKNTDPKNRYSKSGRFIIERRRISSISVGESTAAICIRPHPRFCEFPHHVHDYIEIMYVCKGCITHVIGKEEIKLDTDEMIILGKNTGHSVKATGDNDIGINIIISSELFETIYHGMTSSSHLSDEQIENLLASDGNHYMFFSAKQNIEVKNIIENMVSSFVCKDKTIGYILKQSVSLLLCYLASENQDDTYIERTYKNKSKQKLIDYINSSYSTATLTEAAQMLGLSPSYLSRLVRSYFGSSFKELLMEVRFNAVCDMLKDTELPIGEIITRVGYENGSYFHKEFKKRYGMTPNSYRKKQ
ncbi:MAG: helix-turn-helix domain-containing protein [Ruminococcaceae bacterium]|nr:helix-turn-helix domain-containing protein [Oscillospiraceae bacterium]